MSERLQRTLAFLVLAFCLGGLSWIATETIELVTSERATVVGAVILMLFVSVRVSAGKV